MTTSRSRKAMLILATFGLTMVAAGAAFVWLAGGPSASQFAHLKEPRISRLGDQRMLVVVAKGDPNIVAGRAFETLFASYYKLSGVSKAARPPAPRARWSLPIRTPRSEWEGFYGLPIPADAMLPANARSQTAMRLELNMWPYGEVAELLHVGSYSSEESDITRLHNFVVSKGYAVVGEHEEEYVKGPGMFFAGNPDTYLTIIRLRITPARPGE